MHGEDAKWCQSTQNGLDADPRKTGSINANRHATPHKTSLTDVKNLNMRAKDLGTGS